MHAILCFGDSISFGVGEKPESGWVGRLNSSFGKNDEYNFVVNLGFPGHDSFDLLKRFDTECKTRIKLKRDTDKFLILISIGTNDCRWEDHPIKNKFRTNHEKFQENTIRLIEKAIKFPAKIAFIGIPPANEKVTMPWEEKYYYTNERIKLFNDVVKDTCKKYTIPFLNMFELMSKENYSKLILDGIHPNSKGYDFMYTKIKEFIKKKKLI
jgi:acyl-CoA thioesterase I